MFRTYSYAALAIFTLSFGLSNAFAAPNGLICGVSRAPRNAPLTIIRRVCLLQTEKNRLVGFLLLSSDGSKSYLRITYRRITDLQYQEQFPAGSVFRRYTVKKANRNLEIEDANSRSQLDFKSKWFDQDDGYAHLTGTTPDGRFVDVYFNEILRTVR